ncbi:hypothetical protein C3E79_06845 [Corynebacterium liangguodongii]|uniref:Uncharacterized protein n=2 Tax=Corynebacterium liangguodongii TaxID=2079535 RepID=A0A2S0WH92_9CORY|nr:hypothetical protein C3E79_06845 [Corynebacterium liangguodongii]PWC00332.1 DUF559 domain-containing protein [Corynebacterium liangguodongii]
MWVVATTEERVELSATARSIGASIRKNPRYQARHFRLTEAETYTTEGCRATKLIRTAIDIARTHGFPEGLVAFDWLLRVGVDTQHIRRQIEAMGRFKGARIARQCLAHATPLSESPYESLARALLIAAHFDPVPQFSVGRYRADLGIDGWLLIEIDGDSKYEYGTAETIRKENDRKKQIENQGYRVLRYRPGFLLKNPQGFLNEVKTAYTTRVS